MMYSGKPLLIPVINELFRTDYAMEDAGVLRLANEHLLRDHDSDKENIKRITDGLIKLGDMMYHIECQSTSDGSILIRLVDYNLRIGYEHASHDKKKGCVRIPDLEIMKAVKDAGGIVGCPNDAIEEAKMVSNYISNKDGGSGAVREFIEWVVYSINN